MGGKGSEVDVVVVFMFFAKANQSAFATRQGVLNIPINLTVPGGSASLTSAFDSEKAYFNPDISSVSQANKNSQEQGTVRWREKWSDKNPPTRNDLPQRPY